MSDRRRTLYEALVGVWGMTFLASGRGGGSGGGVIAIVEARAESLGGWGDGFDVRENVIPW